MQATTPEYNMIPSIIQAAPPCSYVLLLLLMYWHIQHWPAAKSYLGQGEDAYSQNTFEQLKPQSWSNFLVFTFHCLYCYS